MEIENFDDGVEGAAYHDLSADNQGGKYRSTGIDIELNSEQPLSAPGYNVGYAFAGEWLAFTPSPWRRAAPTMSAFESHLTAEELGTFHIEVDGVDRTGPLTVPNTGGWQKWVTIRAGGVTLNAGQQLWRIVLDSNGESTAVGNFNWFRVTPTWPAEASSPYGGIAPTLLGYDGRLHIEDFDEGGEGGWLSRFDAGQRGGSIPADRR